MKLSTKWFACYLCLGVYAMSLGGIFYYNLSKGTFDERLKQQAIDLVRAHAYPLIQGLTRRQSAITLAEFDVVSNSLAKDERVASLLYLNRYGEVRWHNDAAMIGKSFDDFRQAVPLPTDAVEQARGSKTPKVRAVDGQPFYEIAIPLAVRGEVVGIVDMQVSRQGSDLVIAQAMRKYLLGAAGVLLMLGIPLYFFLHHFVLCPLDGLCDAAEAVSFKDPELRFSSPTKEVGRLASAMSALLKKVKAERACALAKEKQRGVAEGQWWQSILMTIVSKSHRALVVDEDNSVLYANFPLARRRDGDARLHLLDVIDCQQQDILRLVAAAFGRPNQALETDALFGREPCRVRVVHLEDAGELKRTLILFEPTGAVAGCGA